MDLHRLRVVEFNTLVSDKEVEKKNNAELEEQEEKTSSDDKKGESETNELTSDKKCPDDNTSPQGSSKKICFIKRTSKSEIFKIPTRYKSKKRELKNNSSFVDLTKLSQDAHLNQKKRTVGLFNRKSRVDQKVENVKRKKDEVNFIFARETPSFIRYSKSKRRAKHEAAKKKHDSKLPNDIFGFQTSNRYIDPYLYQMSCNYLNIDKLPFKKVKKRFRRKLNTPPQLEKERSSSHHAMRVLNSRVFGDIDESSATVYYNISPHSHQRKSRRKYEYDCDEALRREHFPCTAKDETVAVSSSSLGPVRKFYCDACTGPSKTELNAHDLMAAAMLQKTACPCDPAPYLQHSTPSTSYASTCPVQCKTSKKTYQKKRNCSIVKKQRSRIFSGFVQKITAWYYKRPSGKNCVKYIFIGILIVVWSPCLLAVLLTWVVMCPVRISNIYTSDKSKKSLSIMNSIMKRFRKKDQENEIEEKIEGNYTPQRNRSFMSIAAKWYSRALGTVFKSFNALTSTIKVKNKSPTGAGTSFLPSAHPNPRKRYTLFYADNRGWMMKPVRRSNTRSCASTRVVHSMRCEYKPTFWKCKSRCDQNAQTKLSLCRNVPYECPIKCFASYSRHKSSPAGDATPLVSNKVPGYFCGEKCMAYSARQLKARNKMPGTSNYVPVASRRLQRQQVNIPPILFQPTSDVSPNLSHYPTDRTQTVNCKPNNMLQKDFSEFCLDERKNGTLPFGVVFKCKYGTKQPLISNTETYRSHNIALAGKTLKMTTKYTPSFIAKGLQDYFTKYMAKQKLTNTNKKLLGTHRITGSTDITKDVNGSKRRSISKRNIYSLQKQSTKCELALNRYCEKINNRQKKSTRNKRVLVKISHSGLTKQAETSTNKIFYANKIQNTSKHSVEPRTPYLTKITQNSLQKASNVSIPTSVKTSIATFYHYGVKKKTFSNKSGNIHIKIQKKPKTANITTTTNEDIALNCDCKSKNQSNESQQSATESTLTTTSTSLDIALNCSCGSKRQPPKSPNKQGKIYSKTQKQLVVDNKLASTQKPSLAESFHKQDKAIQKDSALILKVSECTCKSKKTVITKLVGPEKSEPHKNTVDTPTAEHSSKEPTRSTTTKPVSPKRSKSPKKAAVECACKKEKQPGKSKHSSKEEATQCSCKSDEYITKGPEKSKDEKKSAVKKQISFECPCLDKGASVTCACAKDQGSKCACKVDTKSKQADSRQKQPGKPVVQQISKEKAVQSKTSKPAGAKFETHQKTVDRASETQKQSSKSTVQCECKADQSTTAKPIDLKEFDPPQKKVDSASKTQKQSSKSAVQCECKVNQSTTAKPIDFKEIGSRQNNVDSASKTQKQSSKSAVQCECKANQSTTAKPIDFKDVDSRQNNVDSASKTQKQSSKSAVQCDCKANQSTTAKPLDFKDIDSRENKVDSASKTQKQSSKSTVQCECRADQSTTAKPIDFKEIDSRQNKVDSASKTQKQSSKSAVQCECKSNQSTTAKPKDFKEIDSRQNKVDSANKTQKQSSKSAVQCECKANQSTTAKPIDFKDIDSRQNKVDSASKTQKQSSKSTVQCECRADQSTTAKPIDFKEIDSRQNKVDSASKTQKQSSKSAVQCECKSNQSTTAKPKDFKEIDSRQNKVDSANKTQKQSSKSAVQCECKANQSTTAKPIDFKEIDSHQNKVDSASKTQKQSSKSTVQCECRADQSTTAKPANLTENDSLQKRANSETKKQSSKSAAQQTLKEKVECACKAPSIKSKQTIYRPKKVDCACWTEKQHVIECACKAQSSTTSKPTEVKQTDFSHKKVECACWKEKEPSKFAEELTNQQVIDCASKAQSPTPKSTGIKQTNSGQKKVECACKPEKSTKQTDIHYGIAPNCPCASRKVCKIRSDTKKIHTLDTTLTRNPFEEHGQKQVIKFFGYPSKTAVTCKTATDFGCETENLPNIFVKKPFYTDTVTIADRTNKEFVKKHPIQKTSGLNSHFLSDTPNKTYKDALQNTGSSNKSLCIIKAPSSLQVIEPAPITRQTCDLNIHISKEQASSPLFGVSEFSVKGPHQFTVDSKIYVTNSVGKSHGQDPQSLLISSHASQQLALYGIASDCPCGEDQLGNKNNIYKKNSDLAAQPKQFLKSSQIKLHTSTEKLKKSGFSSDGQTNTTTKPLPIIGIAADCACQTDTPVKPSSLVSNDRKGMTVDPKTNLKIPNRRGKFSQTPSAFSQKQFPLNKKVSRHKTRTVEKNVRSTKLIKTKSSQIPSNIFKNQPAALAPPLVVTKKRSDDQQKKAAITSTTAPPIVVTKKHSDDQQRKDSMISKKQTAIIDPPVVVTKKKSDDQQKNDSTIFKKQSAPMDPPPIVTKKHPDDQQRKVATTPSKTTKPVTATKIKTAECGCNTDQPGKRQQKNKTHQITLQKQPGKKKKPKSKANPPPNQPSHSEKDSSKAKFINCDESKCKKQFWKNALFNREFTHSQCKCPNTKFDSPLGSTHADECPCPDKGHMTISLTNLLGTTIPPSNIMTHYSNKIKNFFIKIRNNLITRIKNNAPKYASNKKHASPKKKSTSKKNATSSKHSRSVVISSSRIEVIKAGKLNRSSQGSQQSKTSHRSFNLRHTQCNCSLSSTPNKKSLSHHKLFSTKTLQHPSTPIYSKHNKIHSSCLCVIRKTYSNLSSTKSCSSRSRRSAGQKKTSQQSSLSLYSNEFECNCHVDNKSSLQLSTISHQKCEPKLSQSDIKPQFPPNLNSYKTLLERHSSLGQRHNISQFSFQRSSTILDSSQQVASKHNVQYNPSQELTNLNRSSAFNRSLSNSSTKKLKANKMSQHSLRNHEKRILLNVKAVPVIPGKCTCMTERLKQLSAKISRHSRKSLLEKKIAPSEPSPLEQTLSKQASSLSRKNTEITEKTSKDLPHLQSQQPVGGIKPTRHVSSQIPSSPDKLSDLGKTTNENKKLFELQSPNQRPETSKDTQTSPSSEQQQQLSSDPLSSQPSKTKDNTKKLSDTPPLLPNQQPQTCKPSCNCCSQTQSSPKKEMLLSDLASSMLPKPITGTTRSPEYTQQIPSQQPNISKQIRHYGSQTTPPSPDKEKQSSEPAQPDKPSQSQVFNPQQLIEKPEKPSEMTSQQPPKTEEEKISPVKQLPREPSKQFIIPRPPYPPDSSHPIIPIIPGMCRCAVKQRATAYSGKNVLDAKLQESVNYLTHLSSYPLPTNKNYHKQHPDLLHFSRKTRQEQSRSSLGSRTSLQSDIIAKYSSRMSSRRTPSRFSRKIITGKQKSEFSQQFPSQKPKLIKSSFSKQRLFSDTIQRSSHLTQLTEKQHIPSYLLPHLTSMTEIPQSATQIIPCSTSKYVNIREKVKSKFKKNSESRLQSKSSASSDALHHLPAEKVRLPHANTTNYSNKISLVEKLRGLPHHIIIQRSEVKTNPLFQRTPHYHKSFQNVQPFEYQQNSQNVQSTSCESPPDQSQVFTAKTSLMSHKSAPVDIPPPGLLQRKSSEHGRKGLADSGVQQYRVQQSQPESQSPYPDFNRVSLRYANKQSGPKKSVHNTPPAKYFAPPADGATPPPNYARYPCFINPANKCGPKTCYDEYALRRAYKRRPLRYIPPPQPLPKTKQPKQKKKSKKEKKAEAKKHKTTYTAESGGKFSGYYNCIRDFVYRTEKEAWPTEVACRPMWIHALKRRPCFWIYDYWPNLYPIFLTCYKFQQNLCQMLMYVISICFWCPLIFCLYFCCDLVCRGG